MKIYQLSPVILVKIVFVNIPFFMSSFGLISTVSTFTREKGDWSS